MACGHLERGRLARWRDHLGHLRHAIARAGIGRHVGRCQRVWRVADDRRNGAAGIGIVWGVGHGRTLGCVLPQSARFCCGGQGENREYERQHATSWHKPSGPCIHRLVAFAKLAVLNNCADESAHKRANCGISVGIARLLRTALRAGIAFGPR